MLALRGVIETTERPEDDTDRTQDDAALLATLDTALADLVRERQAEGAALAATLGERIEEIEALTRQAEALVPARREALGERLREQLAALIGAGAPVPEDRLAAELALLAVKIDVTEEIERLKSHCTAAARQLREEGAVGRKLDFLAQEFNREANTLCSKASDAALTDIGLALKAAIDSSASRRRTWSRLWAPPRTVRPSRAAVSCWCCPRPPAPARRRSPAPGRAGGHRARDLGLPHHAAAAARRDRGPRLLLRRPARLRPAEGAG